MHITPLPCVQNKASLYLQYVARILSLVNSLSKKVASICFERDLLRISTFLLYLSTKRQSCLGSAYHVLDSFELQEQLIRLFANLFLYAMLYFILCHILGSYVF